MQRKRNLRTEREREREREERLGQLVHLKHRLRVARCVLQVINDHKGTREREREREREIMDSKC